MKTLKQFWTEHRWTRPAAVAAGAVLLLLLVVRGCAGGASADIDEPIYRVERGPLTISVVESGSIKAREQIVLKNQLEGRTSVLYVIPEGTQVTNGTLLVELDASTLKDQQVDQQIQVENMYASFITAKENLEVVKNVAQSEVEKAELAAEFAKLDIQKYKEGDFQRDLKEAEARISLAEQDLKRAEEKVNWSRRLYEEEYLSKSELDADEAAFNKARLDLELAEADLDVLKKYTDQRTLAQLESDVRQTEMALERAHRKASADVVQAEANLRAKESEYNRQKDRLDKIIDQLGKTMIYAPADGLVVYATSAQGGWRGNEEPMAEGREVREREELIYLPTASSYKAEVNVHESSLKSIRVGLPATIKVDAAPGRVFNGTVATIAPLPDASSMFWNPDLKVYPTEVHIREESEDLKTGMNCEVEIFVAHYEDVLSVPLQAVLRVRGQPTVYVADGGRFEPREVELGQDNNRLVHVVAGLFEGDRVLLTPPLKDAEQSQQREPIPEAMPEDPAAYRPPGGAAPEAGAAGQGAEPGVNREERRPRGEGGAARPRRPREGGGAAP